ncbi:MAG TPA: hypothetical protein VGA37_07955 [Gemmatimonadales bacterium]
MPRAVAALVVALAGCTVPGPEEVRGSDLDGAHAAFLANIEAIRRHDVDAYLSHYVDSPDFIAVSPAGIATGFEPLAAARRASDVWPDSLVAEAPRLVWLSPGVVYGAYRYVVTQSGSTSTGWSERVFIKTRAGWKIAVTSVIPAGG